MPKSSKSRKKYTPRQIKIPQLLQTPKMQQISELKTHKFLAFARYNGDSVLEFEEGPESVFLDTNDVVKNFCLFYNKNGIEQMSFSNGEITIFAEYNQEEFVEATENEFLESIAQDEEVNTSTT